ncbi:MAG TPA: sodium/proton-translocating pyrophosphatase, partial [Limnochordia bacterium]|nr:sodium/proton-translocating pyrophosphatase [Limnochordia bacterium]
MQDSISMAWLGVAVGVIALGFSAFLAAHVMRQSAGDERMQAISTAVREGAMAFIKSEYTVVAAFGALLAIIFFLVGLISGDAFWHYTGAGFIVGAVFSAVAGYLGLAVSVRANARVAQAARSGLGPALTLAFRAGAVNGFAVVGLGITGVSGLYLIYRSFAASPDLVPLNLIGFAFGASLITLFARIAGGIYTKAADVGADLVGKVEAGIPEDDPRNPAV